MEAAARQAADALRFVIWQGALREGDLAVVGCSTSEVHGGRIGQDSVPELGQALCAALYGAAQEAGVFLAVQCCEHLNRALVLPRAVLCARGYTEVCAVPHPKAGGSLGSAYYRALEDPTLALCIQAEAGIDIGGTLIGMHLRRVAVPVRCEISKVGEAHLILATTRPPLIGGERARYSIE